MKLIHLSLTAGLLLQAGTFVQASPLFTGDGHWNDVANNDPCQDFRITFPANSGLSFEEDTKHLVAWQAPSSLENVDITLVDSNNNNVVGHIGSYGAKRGVSDEVPLTLNGGQPGNYRFHLQAKSSNGATCDLDSVAFQITQSSDNESHSNGDGQNWSAALNNVSGEAAKSISSEPEHYNAEYFTNEDRRTGAHSDNHLNANLKQEIDQLGESTHPNAAWFTNDDQRTGHTNEHNDMPHWNAEDLSWFTNEDHRTTPDHANAEWVEDAIEEPQHNDAEGWEVEEFEHANNEWVDESVNVPDHTNEGFWESEEADTAGSDDAHFNDAVDFEEEEDDTLPEDYVVPDHSNEGHWDAEEIDVASEIANDSQANDDDLHLNEWVEDFASIPDHSNDGEWEEDQVDAHFDGDWHQEEIDDHENEWTPSGPAGSHDNASEWQAVEDDDNVDAVTHGNEWQGDDEGIIVPVDHENDSEWIDVADATVNHDNDVTTWVEDVPAHRNDGQASTGYVRNSEHNNNWQTDTPPSVHTAENYVANW
ncbi:uncharacterized protein BYT42DRAFT_28376 [Radiomyces spectabilis]|uniref:uncharacterized protein n=1 Tax=Radiomyces spectabilis TaxID=64574 RepID=UPI002220C56A|nr:uncharacterized protein BYT42DRAFT_28376 [Radiomyces spectabilis]KAI8394034.1 hypothetical protein BYT42DRAFT_28376 [Radiomyces spectabilis]